MKHRNFIPANEHLTMQIARQAYGITTAENALLFFQDDDFALEGGLFGKEYYSETYLQKGHPCQDDFITFGKTIAVPDVQIQKTMRAFLASQSLVYELTERSFLDDRLKRMYIRSYEERLNRFGRTTAD